MGREGMGRSGEDVRQLTRAFRLVSLMPLSLRASPRMVWGLASETYTVVSFGITSFLWVSPHPPPIPIASSS